MKRLLTARVQVHTQQQTGDATIVCRNTPETLMLAILGNIFGALIP